MLEIADNLAKVKRRIAAAEQQFGLADGGVTLLAVSKTKPVADILRAIDAGQTEFGENYVLEAVEKIRKINRDKLQWHFIGPIQSNKTRLIAEYFSWVHSVDRLKIAQRLNDQRPDSRANLNICLQVNVSNEESKSGALPVDLPDLVDAVIQLQRLNLCGLMAIPAKSMEQDEQRRAFKQLKENLVRLNSQFNLNMKTLSMGMSNDMEAAIAEGATIVRIGSDIFGARG